MRDDDFRLVTRVALLAPPLETPPVPIQVEFVFAPAGRIIEMLVCLGSNTMTIELFRYPDPFAKSDEEPHKDRRNYHVNLASWLDAVAREDSRAIIAFDEEGSADALCAISMAKDCLTLAHCVTDRVSQSAVVLREECVAAFRRSLSKFYEDTAGDPWSSLESSRRGELQT